MTVRCLALAALISAAVNPVSAQDIAPTLASYQDAVRRFQATGSLDGSPVAGWAPNDLAAVVSAQAALQHREIAEPGGLMHTEIAIGLVVESPDAAVAHLRLAEVLLVGLAENSRSAALESRSPTGGFMWRWYALAASIFLSQTDTTRAIPFVERGQQLVPDSAVLHMMVGIVNEIDAITADPDDEAGERRSAALRTSRERREAAGEAFRRALKLDPSLTVARLHLGRVLYLLDKTTEARSELLRARQGATDTTDEYLAALFLGAVYQRTRDFAAARTAFEHALAVAPDRQTPYVALAHLEDLAGRPERARAVVAEFVARTTRSDDDEWWAYRNGGLETRLLAWLRVRVRP
jgi:tetratricopeptide (TPR) repeat protein